MEIELSKMRNLGLFQFDLSRRVNHEDQSSQSHYPT